MAKKKESGVETVNVIQSKLLSEEPLNTLVRVPFEQIVGLGMDKLLQNLSVLAIGPQDSGNFKIDKLIVQLAGTIEEDVVFRVKGNLQKYQVVQKVEQQNTKKKKVR